MSILLVVLSHLLGSEGIRLAPQLLPPVDIGRFGVRVFFVISGFLITNLLLQERQSAGTINLGRFYFRRTLRIFPAYYVFLAAMLVAHSLSWAEFTKLDMIHALTYTSNYSFLTTGLPYLSTILGHTWSLAVEEQFYLLWPVRCCSWARAVGSGSRRCSSSLLR